MNRKNVYLICYGGHWGSQWTPSKVYSCVFV